MWLACVLLPAILLPCISLHAHAVEPGQIAVPSIAVPNMDMPAPVPQPNMDMPSTNPTPVARPCKDTCSSLDRIGSLGFNQTQRASEQGQQKAGPMDIAGKWSIRFDGESGRSMDLNLWPSMGTAGVMGFGTLTEDGVGNSVTASGSVTEEKVKLTTRLTTPGTSGREYYECDLNLFKTEGHLSGTYILKSSCRTLSVGNATAVKQ
jgi:hypothetical protein